MHIVAARGDAALAKLLLESNADADADDPVIDVCHGNKKLDCSICDENEPLIDPQMIDQCFLAGSQHTAAQGSQ